MPLDKETVLDKIEILENGTIQVRMATYITEDGKRIAGPQYHRSGFVRGSDVSREDVRLQAIAEVVWKLWPPAPEPPAA